MKPSFDNLPANVEALLAKVEAMEVLLKEILLKLENAEANSTQPTNPNDLLTIKEVQAILRCNRGTVYNHIANGLQFVKVGRKTLFKRKHVIEFEKQQNQIQLTSLKKSS